ncbi:ethanolamine utilization microcompartment protein EutN [Gammaproteobacteria bacterium ESL0073]|uniref:Ethanolamine utilization microcompartment protein EutN n=1 Tax=Entomomonas moraniae TaxID=2213226 RepID=A0A3S9XFP3_9GAMM|nr:EutN/CcmL family microcompartment protein [Entomomonas moraniae]AWM79243.1 ethanolamine utilization microcompartment protein EutN [Gammaproteobacteria bacterium ESL0073]AZS51116.1 ethanolamine utilization microcompartment protein EutN [Entomomonas moraniae]
MKLAVVVGQIVSTVKLPSVGHDRLLLVDIIDKDGLPGERLVATDSVGAGDGEWVLIVSGSAARKTMPSTNDTEAPIDASVIGIVDEAVVNGNVFYHK